MQTHRTILAVASPPGAARRGIVRMSGPGTAEVLRRHVRCTEWDAAAGGGDTSMSSLDASRAACSRAAPPAVPPAAPPAAPGRGLWPAQLMDVPGVAGPMPCLVAVMEAGASYTGEASAELLLPGAPWLLEAVTDGLVAAGRAAGDDLGRAGPGEFTARAWQAGRISLDEAEAVAATIAADDAASLAAARAVAAGAIGDVSRELETAIVETLARLEAGTDFADEEDVVAISAAALAAAIDAHLAAATRVLDRLRGGRERADGRPVVLLVGRPNAGKSTLANALAGADAVLASPLAGTTRDVLDLEVRVPGPGPGEPERWVHLQDAAGLDGAGRADGLDETPARAGDRPPRTSGDIERAAAERTRDAATTADLLVHCVPVDEPVEDPEQLLDHAGFGSVAGVAVRARIVLVRTMADRLVARAPVDRSRGDATVSAVLGEGLDAVRAAIAAGLDAGARSDGDVGVVPRHRAALERAAEGLAEAAAWIAPAAAADPQAGPPDPEIVAAMLRSAADAVAGLHGGVTPDDVLDVVFGRFCIGK